MKLHYWKILLGCFGICLWIPGAFAADRYWVGTRNNSDRWESTANWSAIPRGAGGASIPGSSDKAIFNYSGTTVRLRSFPSIHDLVMTNTWTGTLLLGGTGGIAIGVDDLNGSLRIGSGTIVGNNQIHESLPTFGVFGTFIQTGGIMRGFQGTTLRHGFAVTDNFTLRSVNGSRPTFTMTGSFVHGPLNDSTMYIDTSSNVTFSVGNFTIDDTLGAGGSRLIFSGNHLRIGGNLAFITGGILDLDTRNASLSVAGNITFNNNLTDVSELRLGGTLSLSGNIVKPTRTTIRFTASGQTVRLNGSTQTLSGSLAFSGLTVASSVETLLLRNNVSVSGNSTLTIATGSTLKLRGRTIFATGSTIRNYGTLTEGTGAVIHTPQSLSVTDSAFNATSTATITGGVGQLFVQLNDSDENINGTSRNAVNVTLALANGDSETLTMEETGDATGIFRGAIVVSVGSVVAGNGSLQLTDTTTATVTFTDAEDALTATASATLAIGSATASSGVSGGGGSRGSTLFRRQNAAVDAPSQPRRAVLPQSAPPTSSGREGQLTERMCMRAMNRLKKMPSSARQRAEKRLRGRCGW